MIKLLSIFCLLILLEHKLEAQSGRYTIDEQDGKKAEGYITISPYAVTIFQDSTEIPLPVTQVVVERDRIYYFLKGCYMNVSFRGAATLFQSDYKKDGIYNCVLYIEIRTSQSYSFTRFGLYYNNENR